MTHLSPADVTQRDPAARSVPDRSPLDSPSLPEIFPWQLVQRLGESPLAEVYRARPSDRGANALCDYTFKLLKSAWENDATAVTLFRREAVVGRRVCHPHLVSVLDCHVSQPPYFLVMPYLEGVTVEALLAAQGIPAPSVAFWIVRQVAEALDALHTAGWIHSDVKPANVLVAPDGHATLLDLGLLRAHEEGARSLEQPVLGTFQYIAPEAVTSTFRIDARSDIYSLGVVLFELLTGHRPGRHSAHDVTRYAPELPGATALLVREMLAGEPLRRPQTAREVVQRLIGLEIATLAESVPAA